MGVKDLPNLNKPVLGTQTEPRVNEHALKGTDLLTSFAMPSNKLPINNSTILTVQKDGLSSL